MAKTQDGFEAMQWCGQRPAVTGMVFFTGYQTSALCPGGQMTIKAPGKDIYVNVGQWVVKKDDGLQVVDDDKIVLAH